MTRRLKRVSRDDALDVASAQLFVNSYLALVLLLWLRLESVADVLKAWESRQTGKTTGVSF